MTLMMSSRHKFIQLSH